MTDRFVSGCCEGERCNYQGADWIIKCGKPAEHKVEETIFHDDPHQVRHGFTAYVCHEHFVAIMGKASK